MMMTYKQDWTAFADDRYVLLCMVWLGVDLMIYEYNILGSVLRTYQNGMP